MSTPIVPTLKGQCIAEFLGTALLIFFGTGCVAALKLGGADLGLWEICIIWGIGYTIAYPAWRLISIRSQRSFSTKRRMPSSTITGAGWTRIVLSERLCMA